MFMILLNIKMFYLQRVPLKKLKKDSKMKKINYLDSIKSPIITEKATGLSEQNKVIFKVHENASKNSIKKNIEKIFKVKVIKINIINTKQKQKIKQGKLSTKSGYKKAIITLKKGQSIDLTTGL